MKTQEIKEHIISSDVYIFACSALRLGTMTSFGTNVLNGNACIITDNNGIYFVHAIQNSPKQS